MSSLLRSSLAAGLLLAAVHCQPFRVAPDARKTVNADGGTTMNDGVRFTYTYGSFQIMRSEVGGFAGGKKGEVTVPDTTAANMDTGILVAIGGETFTLDMGHWSGFSLATSSDTQQDCDAQMLSYYSISKGSHTYELRIVGMYTYPDNYIRLKLRISIPPGTSDRVIVYITGKGQGTYNDTGEEKLVEPVYANGTLGTRNANSYNEADSHLITLFRYIKGLPWTGQFYGNPTCGFVSSGCDAQDVNPSDLGPVTHTNVPSYVNTQPLDPANVRTTISIDFGTTGIHWTELALGLVTVSELPDVLAELPTLGKFRESICMADPPVPLMDPINATENPQFARYRMLNKPGFRASAKEVISEDYAYFPAGFENAYFLMVSGNVGRINIPLARNTSGISQVRVTIIPFTTNYQYASEYASAPVTTWLDNDLPAPPLFRYVKAEFGQRVGIDKGVSPAVAVRVQVLDEFDNIQPFFMPVNHTVPNFNEPGYGHVWWHPVIFGMSVGNRDEEFVDGSDHKAFQIPLIIHQVINMEDV